MVDPSQVISSLRTLINNIEQNTYNSECLQEIYDTTLPYITGERPPIDPEMAELLFLGWYLRPFVKAATDLNASNNESIGNYVQPVL